MKTQKKIIKGGDNTPVIEEELSSTSTFHNLSKKILNEEKEKTRQNKNSSIGKILELGTLDPQFPSPPNIYKPPEPKHQTKEERLRNAKIRQFAEE